MPKLSLKKLKKAPGVRQLRGVKDKAAIKLFEQAESKRKEKEQIFASLSNHAQQLRQEALDTVGVIEGAVGSDDYDQAVEELAKADALFKMTVVSATNCQKEAKKALKYAKLYSKIENGLLKIASKDAVVADLLKG